jgi:hypothetical protein
LAFSCHLKNLKAWPWTRMAEFKGQAGMVNYAMADSFPLYYS